MSELIMGAIILFGGDFEPQGYIRCDGRLLPIARYQPLYTILGNRFGGDSQNFALPKLTAPDPELAYFICVNGMYPAR